MKISLNPDTERMITERINSGRYRSADEVVREGLELLQREEKTGLPRPQRSADLASVFGAIVADVPDADWAIVPVDLSKRLDHYLYKRPKKS